MTNGMATTKLLMKADMLGKSVWQWLRIRFVDGKMKDVRVPVHWTGVGGFQGCIEYLDIV